MQHRGPEYGLSFYERAMNSGKFDDDGLQRISEMQLTMYSRTEEKIPIRKRGHLKNLTLKPLLLIDTNLLVDALSGKVLRHLDVEKDMPMHLDNRREFHRTLAYRNQQGRLELYVPPAVRNELLAIAATDGRIRDILGEQIIDPKAWEKRIDKNTLKRIAKETIDEYSSWSPMSGEGVNDEINDYRDGMDAFFLGLRDVYEKITDSKAMRGHDLSKRQEIKGEAIYPEGGDMDIMRLAAWLADQSIDGFGSILVASRDSDFTIPARSFQERFGFTIVENGQDLARFTH